MIEIFAFKKVYNGKFGKLKYAFFSRQRTGGISFEISRKSPICAQFINEHSGHYFGKHYQLLNELQVGIEEFDTKVYIYSEQNALRDLLVKNIELRDAISRSLELNGELIIKRNTMVLKIFPDQSTGNDIYKSKEALFELIEQKHELLEKIARNWDFSDLELDTKIESRIYSRGILLNITTYVYFVFSVFAINYTSVHREMMLTSDSWVYSFFFSMIFILILFWSSFRFLKSSSWTFHYLIKNWLIQVLATLMISFSFIPFINVMCDKSEIKIVNGTLVTKRLPQGKGRPSLTYKLNGDKNIYYKPYVDFKDFDSHKIGEIRKFELHSGYFGYKWGRFLSP